MKGIICRHFVDDLRGKQLLFYGNRQFHIKFDHQQRLCIESYPSLVLRTFWRSSFVDINFLELFLALEKSEASASSSKTSIN